ncbi:hypothetical protein JRO89_XS01G0117200 [Xanthoceras sorbifolium]|uniref:protein acetyllysine N-acetyltransferase n=1 Tax=Xanthoceras sorbifolium TaxID=99658 RepID=A0ABQ8IJP7_9ROSI|nr:hypothetical protein JRO89_XS01G0117200 [Xanthoceras sorbifolium]
MSLGYAKKLSYREDVGSVGMSEIFDQPHVLQQKILSVDLCSGLEEEDLARSIEEVAAIIKESKHLVAFTGAGISTSCGIPDFRGPKGVWTLQSEGKDVPEASVPFHCAMPSITHMALVELEKAGILKFVISQNVDSLHLRSGIPREKLAELHGNSFSENCQSCGVEYLRDFEIETIGMKKTPRRCADVQCGDRLRDTVVDWEVTIPLLSPSALMAHSKIMRLFIPLSFVIPLSFASCITLYVTLIASFTLYIILQPTPKDNKASLVIHGLVDKVISGLIHHLDLRIPPHVRVDLLSDTLRTLINTDKYVQWSLKIGRVFGIKAPLPWIKSVEVSFIATPNLKKAVLHKQPFMLKRKIMKTRSFIMVLKLNFCNGCGSQCAVVEFPVNFEERADSISHDKDAVIQQLRDAAIENQCCGQSSLVERKQTHSRDLECSLHSSILNTCTLFSSLFLQAFLSLLASYLPSSWGLRMT